MKIVIKMIAAGLPATVGSILFSALLWMNPAVGEFYSSFEGHPHVKPMGEANFVSILFLFVLFAALIELFVGRPKKEVVS